MEQVLLKSKCCRLYIEVIWFSGQMDLVSETGNAQYLGIYHVSMVGALVCQELEVLHRQLMLYGRNGQMTLSYKYRKPQDGTTYTTALAFSNRTQHCSRHGHP